MSFCQVHYSYINSGHVILILASVSWVGGCYCERVVINNKLKVWKSIWIGLAGSPYHTSIYRSLAATLLRYCKPHLLHCYKTHSKFYTYSAWQTGSQYHAVYIILYHHTVILPAIWWHITISRNYIWFLPHYSTALQHHQTVCVTVH